MAFPSNPTNADFYTDEKGIRWQVTIANGVKRWLRAPLPYALPVPTGGEIGGVKSGSGPITIAPNGSINIDALTTLQSNSADAVNATAAANAATAAAAAHAAANAAQLTAAGKAATVIRDGNNIILKDAAGTVLSSVALGDLGIDISADAISIDGNFVMSIMQTNGGGTKTIDLRTLKPVASTNSISGDGDSAPLKLVGDAATPGVGKFYGTDANGAKGYQVLPRFPKTWTTTPDATATIDDKWVDGITVYLPVVNADATGFDWLQTA